MLKNVSDAAHPTKPFIRPFAEPGCHTLSPEMSAMSGTQIVEMMLLSHSSWGSQVSERGKGRCSLGQLGQNLIRFLLGIAYDGL